MQSDSVEVRLRSVEEAPEVTYTVSTTITAYLKDTAGREAKTLIFDCDPIGDNYRTAYLRIKLGDWSEVRRIHNFLDLHFSDFDGKRRTLTVPVVDGHYSLAPEGGGEPRELDDIEQISVVADGTSLDFGPGTMSPNIRTYQKMENGEPQDEKNAKELLEFLAEIIDNVETETSWERISDLEELDSELAQAEVVEQLEAGHPQSAIRDAFKVLEERVRMMGDFGPESHGTSMMQEAFSPDGGPLAFGETRSEKLGAMRLYAGAMQIFRNPASHRSIPLESQEAKEIICFVNLLLRLLERNNKQN